MSSHFGTIGVFFLFPFTRKILTCFNDGTDATGKAGLDNRLLAKGLSHSYFLSSIVLFGLKWVVALVRRDKGVKTEMI